MKSCSFLLVAAVFLALPALAMEPPASRTCRISGGQPWVLDVGSADDLEICRFGLAAIGSSSLYEALILTKENEAVRAFRFAQHPAWGDCALVSGTLHRRVDSDGVTFEICEFSDGSTIEAETLFRGNQDPENAQLSRLLGL